MDLNLRTDKIFRMILNNVLSCDVSMLQSSHMVNELELRCVTATTWTIKDKCLVHSSIMIVDVKGFSPDANVFLGLTTTICRNVERYHAI